MLSCEHASALSCTEGLLAACLQTASECFCSASEDGVSGPARLLLAPGLRATAFPGKCAAIPGEGFSQLPAAMVLMPPFTACE